MALARNSEAEVECAVTLNDTDVEEKFFSSRLLLARRHTSKV
jgi:hypothetical protein